MNLITHFIASIRDDYYRHWITESLTNGISSCGISPANATKIGFYLPSNATILVAHRLLLGRGFSPLSQLVIIGAMGAIIQGRPNCPAQQVLENSKPGLAMFIGAINWNLCCMLTEASMKLVPLGIIGKTVGFLAATAIGSIMMCEIEQFANDPSKYCTKNNMKKKGLKVISILSLGYVKQSDCCHH